MSLGAIFIKADDNKYYKEPVIRGEDFFICFDENEYPELVLKRNGSNMKECQTKVETILNNLKLNTEIKKPGQFSSRIFSKNKSSFKFINAFSIYVNIKSKIPAMLLKDNEGIYESETTLYGEYTVCDFSKDIK